MYLFFCLFEWVDCFCFIQKYIFLLDLLMFIIPKLCLWQIFEKALVQLITVLFVSWIMIHLRWKCVLNIFTSICGISVNVQKNVNVSRNLSWSRAFKIQLFSERPLSSFAVVLKTLDNLWPLLFTEYRPAGRPSLVSLLFALCVCLWTVSAVCILDQ